MEKKIDPRFSEILQAFPQAQSWGDKRGIKFNWSEREGHNEDRFLITLPYKNKPGFFLHVQTAKQFIETKVYYATAEDLIKRIQHYIDNAKNYQIQWTPSKFDLFFAEHVGYKYWEKEGFK
jgi:hypothetical protein